MKIKKFLILQFCNTVLLITGSIPQIGRWYAEPVFSFFTGKSYSEEWFCNPFWTLISAWPMIFREAITPGLCFRLCLINFLLAVIVTAGLTRGFIFAASKRPHRGGLAGFGSSLHSAAFFRYLFGTTPPFHIHFSTGQLIDLTF